MMEKRKLTVSDEDSEMWWLSKGIKDGDGATVAWMTNDADRGLAQQIVRAVNTFEQAKAALRMLHDVQNGCPLPSYEKDWNEAMRLTEEVLAVMEAPQ